jgi:tetratricopeptide (TPR) repeat protein
MQEILKSQNMRVFHSKAMPNAPVAAMLADYARQAFESDPSHFEGLSDTAKNTYRTILLEQKTNVQYKSNDSFDLYRTLLEILLSKTQPTILALDDLQWADALTVSLLGQLLAHKATQSLYLIATLRNTEPSHCNWQTLFGCCDAKVISLEPLSEDDLGHLINSLNNDSWDSQTLRKISGGNPLYALELLRNQNTQHSVVQVSNLIRLRLQNLNGVERQTLEGLAVLGGKHDLHTISLVTARSPQELIESTDNLGRSGLLGNDQHGLYLNHDLTRAVLLEDMGAARKSMLLLRAARATKMPSIAAQHYWDARHVWSPKDRRNAHNTFQALANRYGRHGDLEQAILWFDRQSETSQTDTERLEALLKKAEWYAKQNRHNNALEALDGAKILLYNVDDIYVHATADLIRARVLIRDQQHPKQATQYLETAMQRLFGTRTARAEMLRADAYMLLGWCHQYLGSLEQSRQCYAQALEKFEYQSDQFKVAEILGSVAAVEVQAGQYEVAENKWKTALLMYEQMNHQSMLVTTLNNLCSLLWQQNKLNKALELAERAEQIASEYQYTNSLGLVLQNKGAIYFLQNEHLRALDAYQCAIQIWESAGLAPSLEMRFNVAEVLFYLGRHEEALLSLELFWTQAEQTSRLESRICLSAHCLSCEILLGVQQFSIAQQHLNNAKRIVTMKNLDVYRPKIESLLTALHQAMVQFKVNLSPAPVQSFSEVQ